jgi:hypothetical protein
MIVYWQWIITKKIHVLVMSYLAQHKNVLEKTNRLVKLNQFIRLEKCKLKESHSSDMEIGM